MTASTSPPPPPTKGLFSLDPPVLGSIDPTTNGRVIERGGMWPSQRAWWDLSNRVRLFVGGYGSGKTLQLCKRMITLAIHNAPVPVAIVSPTYPMAKQTVIVTLRDLLTSIESWLAVWREAADATKRARMTWRELKTSPHEFIVEYHEEGRRSVTAKILVYSGEDPNKLKGPNLAAAGIDEPFIQDLAVFEQMNVRCRHPQARRREINLTGTPEQLNWGYDLAEGELAQRHDVGIIQASTLENEALPIDYIADLEAAFDPKAAQAYLYGMFVNLSQGLVYYSFDTNENVVELDMPPGAELFAGMDFNVNPMSATVGWVIRSGMNRHVHYFDEIELSNSDTQEMCAVLIEKYGQRGWVQPYCVDRREQDLYFVQRPLDVVYPDSNVGRSTSSPGGKTDYDYIRDAGLTPDYRATGNPLRRDRFNCVNNMLREHDGRVRMTFSPRCKKLVKYQMLYSYELMNRENQKSMSHLLDARDYPICRMFPVGREMAKQVRLTGV
tara:strand:+ start:2226 stop:3716 length:1491 start_codon:yes stop_codon:yes gene_type:complete